MIASKLDACAIGTEIMSDARIIDGLGLWFEPLNTAFAAGRPALFLDRDGVIVEETHYLGRAEDVRMIPGAARAIKWANGCAVPVVLVTNQAGIGRGYFDWSGFAAVQAMIVAQLKANGARLDVVLACAFHQKAKGRYAEVSHPWRKPNPGMIMKAAQLLAINVPASLIIGDKLSDLEAGMAAGVGRGLLVESGHGRAELANFQAAALAPMQVAIARDISDALDHAVTAGWPS
jgi:D-glycero-D-manno-heptose 1,7-bisphosphate phosphatase